MRLNWRSLVSLKASVIIVFIALWNAGFLLASHLGGGGAYGSLTPIGMKVSGAVCAAASLFSLAVAISSPFQAAVIAPTRAVNFNPKEFYFLALITGLLAISRFIFPMLGAGANAF